MNRRKFLSNSRVILGFSVLNTVLAGASAKAANWSKIKSSSGSPSTWRKLTLAEPSGRPYAWGAGSNGRLGNNTTSNACVPTKVCNISNAVALSTGQASAIVLGNGCIMAWGDNGAGQVGDGTTTHRSTPVLVCGITNAVSVQTNFHSRALLSSGVVMTWGYGVDAQNGDNSTSNRSIPVAVCGISTAIAIGGSTRHGFAILSDGTLMGWGSNAGGQLGDGTNANRCVPVAITGVSNVVAVANWTGTHSIILLSNGTVMASGGGTAGALGNNSTAMSYTFVGVCCISTAIAISGLHYEGGMALLSDGTIRAWGCNDSGQLGDNTTTNRSMPVLVCGISQAVAIASGECHAMALLADGTVKSWGKNYFGQLGDGTTTTRLTPVTVGGLPLISAIAAGDETSTAT